MKNIRSIPCWILMFTPAVCFGQTADFVPADEFMSILKESYPTKNQLMYSSVVSGHSGRTKYGCLDVSSDDNDLRLNKLGFRLPRLQPISKRLELIESKSSRNFGFKDYDYFVRRYQYNPCPANAHFVEFGQQGLFPVVNVFDVDYFSWKNPEWGYSHRRGFNLVSSVFSHEPNPTDHWSFSLKMPGFMHSPTLPSGGYRDPWDKEEDHVESALKTMRPLAYNQTVAMDIEFNGIVSGDLVRLSLVERVLGEPTLSRGRESYRWTANFKLIGCQDSNYNQILMSRFARTTTTSAEWVSVQNDFKIPGLRSCVLEAEYAGTDQVGEWTEDFKRVVPALENVRVEMNQNHATISYEAMGHRFGTEAVQRVAREDSRYSESAHQTLSETLGVLWEGMRVITQTVPAEDSNAVEVATLSGFLLARKDEIRSKIQSLSENLAEEGNFFQILDTVVSLRRAYRALDRAIGLASQHQTSLDRYLEVPALALSFGSTPTPVGPIQVDRSEPSQLSWLGKTVTRKENTGIFEDTIWEVLEVRRDRVRMRLVDAEDGRWMSTLKKKNPYLYVVPSSRQQRENKGWFLRDRINFPDDWEVLQ